MSGNIYKIGERFSAQEAWQDLAQLATSSKSILVPPCGLTWTWPSMLDAWHWFHKIIVMLGISLPNLMHTSVVIDN